jgi:hypothetical protein
MEPPEQEGAKVVGKQRRVRRFVGCKEVGSCQQPIMEVLVRTILARAIHTQFQSRRDLRKHSSALIGNPSRNEIHTRKIR